MKPVQWTRAETSQGGIEQQWLLINEQDMTSRDDRHEASAANDRTNPKVHKSGECQTSVVSTQIKHQYTSDVTQRSRFFERPLFRWCPHVPCSQDRVEPQWPSQRAGHDQQRISPWPHNSWMPNLDSLHTIQTPAQKWCYVSSPLYSSSFSHTCHVYIRNVHTFRLACSLYCAVSLNMYSCNFALTCLKPRRISE